MERFRRISILQMFLIFLITTGCQKGCTTSTTVETKSKTIKVGDTEGTVSVRLVEYKHIKAKQVGKANSSAKYTYAIMWDVDFPFWTKKDVAYEGTTKDIDLNAQLDRFKIKMSEGAHFAYGIDDQLMGVMHVVNNQSFEDPKFVGVEYDFVSYEKFNVESFEDPEEIIANILDKDELCSSVSIISQESIANIIKGLPEDHGLNKLAFKSWPECEISKKIFTKEKLKSLVKESEDFKTSMIEKLRTVVTDDNSGMFDIKDALEVALEIEDEEIIKELDLMVKDQWAGFMSNEIDEYISKRSASTDLPMDEAAVAAYVDKCNATIKDVVKGKRVFKTNLDAMIGFLISQEKSDELDYFISNAFNKKAIDKNFAKIDKAITENFNSFSDKHRTDILKEYESNFGKLETHDHVAVFEFLRKHLSCESLATLQSKYPKKLKDERLPLKCE